MHPDFKGNKNPNWKGGLYSKFCWQCGASFAVKYCRKDKARFCSLACANKYQTSYPSRLPIQINPARGPRTKRVAVPCNHCGKQMDLLPCHVGQKIFCSNPCQFAWRSVHNSGANNPNWRGGLSRLPYPWNFNGISKTVIARDGNECHGLGCHGNSTRLTTHHINYDKLDCSDENLIALCTPCNSRANFRRHDWQAIYSAMTAERLGKHLVLSIGEGKLISEFE